MAVLMVANIKLSKAEGISKKILAQAKAISINNEKCELLCLEESGIVLLLFTNGLFTQKKQLQNIETKNICSLKDKRVVTNGLCEAAIQMSIINTYSHVYLRHMVPNSKVIKFLYSIKNIRIYYEIPTYPYFYEQLKVSNNKVRTIVRLLVECLFWPFIYGYIYKLVIIQSNVSAHKFKKMISIYNGFDSVNIQSEYKEPETKNLNMVGVGTIYSYHGYDYLIEAIHEFYNKRNDYNVYFHIIGESQELEELKQLVKKLGIEEYVLFYGALFGRDLDNMFENFNLGVGCLALERRKANIDTSIKNIEYLARQIPFITNGNFFDFSVEQNFYAKIDNKNINFNELLAFSQSFYKNRRNDFIEDIVCQFEWKNILKEVFNESSIN